MPKGVYNHYKIKGKHPKSEFKKGIYQGFGFKKGMTSWNKGIPRSPETKEKIRKSHQGKHYPKISKAKKGKELSDKTKRKIQMAMLKIRKKSHLWKGGISFEPYSVDWTDTLKKSIRERDHYICQLCFKDGYPVHHIDYDKKNCNPDNLITLCNSCNSKVNFNRDYWTNYFIKKGRLRIRIIKNK